MWNCDIFLFIRSEFPPSRFSRFFYFSIVLPAVQDHTDGGTFDGLVLACTEFDEIAGGELLREKCEE